jgi:hypothetical protein
VTYADVPKTVDAAGRISSESAGSSTARDSTVMKINRNTGLLLLTVAGALLAAACSRAAAKTAPPPPPDVSVIQIEGEDVATFREYPARTYARDMVEVRGRVDGYVDRRTFEIGSDVRAGQVLYVMVIAIVTVILGAVAIPNLPIATYPEVVPPVVQITANLRGGNAQDLERTVAQPIEQQFVALDGMLYFFSRSSNDGVLTIDVTYDLGTNVDTAVVQTQNRVNLALPSLPPEVQREGVTVKKLSTAILCNARSRRRKIF